MTTPTPEAIEAAEAAVRKYYSMGGWVRTADVAKLAVEAAYPLMVAQAKAEALREAADNCSPDYETTDTRSVAKWLRARAATIEGKDS